MTDVKTVAIVTHGDLVTFAGPYAYEIVVTGQSSVVHDQGVPTSSGNDFQISQGLIAKFFERISVSTWTATQSTLIDGTTWGAHAITGTGTFTLAAAANGATHWIVDQALLEQGSGHIAVNRLGLIKKSGIFIDGSVGSRRC
jgi:hypothetical protein